MTSFLREEKRDQYIQVCIGTAANSYIQGTDIEGGEEGKKKGI